MDAADKILIVGGVVMLVYGFVTGFIIGSVRRSQPVTLMETFDTPKMEINCSRRSEAIRIMQRYVPCTFATLRETAEHDALVVDLEALLYGGDGLEHIHFAGPMPARAIDAAKAIELNLALIGYRCIAGRAGREKAVDELSLGGVVLASVHPHVEARGLRRIVILR